MCESTLRALASNLRISKPGVFWQPAPPALPPPSLGLKFVAHHPWDPVKRVNDSAPGMPRGSRMGFGYRDYYARRGHRCPHPLGLAGEFSAPSLKSALRLSPRAAARPRQRKSKNEGTGDAFWRSFRVPVPAIASSISAIARCCSWPLHPPTGGVRTLRAYGLRIWRTKTPCWPIHKIRIHPPCPASRSISAALRPQPSMTRSA